MRSGTPSAPSTPTPLYSEAMEEEKEEEGAHDAACSVGSSNALSVEATRSPAARRGKLVKKRRKSTSRRRRSKNGIKWDAKEEPILDAIAQIRVQCRARSTRSSSGALTAYAPARATQEEAAAREAASDNLSDYSFLTTSDMFASQKEEHSCSGSDHAPAADALVNEETGMLGLPPQVNVHCVANASTLERC